IALAEEQKEYVSLDLFEKQKDINEENIDWLETQQELIGKVVLPNYLQTAAQED
ncbi:bacterioferritin, partial [Neisseria sp. P0004.S009]